MKCSSCGFENEEGAKFCQSCGGKVEAGAPMEEGPPPETDAGASPPPPPPPPSSPPSSGPAPSGQIDIGGWISKGFSETFANFGNYILLGLVVGLVSGVTFGILMGPLYAGALVVVRRKLRGTGTIDVGQVFSLGFEKFLPTFLIVFVPMIAIGIIVGILNLIYIGPLVGLAVSGFMMPFFSIGLHYIMEENMDFMDAGKKAIAVIQTNLVMFWVLGLVTGIIAGIGGIVCGVGAFITVPVGIIMMALMLESYFPKK